MAVEYRFDFLGMYFEPANVDDAVAPALEVIAAIAQVEHVASIDKALRVFQCGRILAEIALGGAAGADAQRCVHHAHVDTWGASQHGGWEPWQRVADIEGHTGFR